MASYTAEKGAILQPGNQINRLSSYNTEGVFGWPGFELYEMVGYVKVTNLAADKADNKSFNLTVPSPDRRSSDRVRDDRTSLVVQADADRPAYIYSASICIGQDIPSAGEPSYPATPLTADIDGTNTEILLFGPDNSGSPYGVPATQANGLLLRLLSPPHSPPAPSPRVNPTFPWQKHPSGPPLPPPVSTTRMLQTP